MDDDANPELTVWIERLSQGDAQAADVIWQAYFEKLVSFARRKLASLPRRAVDEEDIALSVMQSFCHGAAHGKFDQLTGRDDLWKLLLTITARKVHRQIQHQCRQKRGGGRVRGESVFQGRADEAERGGLGEVLGKEPSPELAAEFAENCQLLLNKLDDESLRRVAGLRLEGYTTEEIAKQLSCAPRTVQRKLELIRRKWTAEQ